MDRDEILESIHSVLSKSNLNIFESNIDVNSVYRITIYDEDNLHQLDVGVKSRKIISVRKDLKEQGLILVSVTSVVKHSFIVLLIRRKKERKRRKYITNQLKLRKY